MYKVGFMCIGVGIFALLVILKGYVRLLGPAIFTVCYFVLFGAALLVGGVLQDDRFCGIVICTGLAIIFFFCGGLCATEPYFLCKKETEGVFLRPVLYNNGWYKTCFKYRIANGSYLVETSENTYKKRTIKRKFKENQVYRIWYSEENPTLFFDQRKSGIPMGMFFCGTGLLCLGIMFAYIL